ncbi:protein kinase [bacterium]|nr:protein kinase [bacterium]
MGGRKSLYSMGGAEDGFGIIPGWSLRVGRRLDGGLPATDSGADRFMGEPLPDEASVTGDDDDDTAIDDFDLEEALGDFNVEEVRPILDLIDMIGRSSSETFPKKFARFRIDRVLGDGGFGIVYQAYDPQLDRAVALKLPRFEVLSSPSMVDRFQDEARAAAGLSHPNIVQVYDAGEHGPTCYIVSEFCEGSNLRDWLAARREPVPSIVAARFALSLADAVAYAQRSGVLHRDIKPSNILMAKPPREFDFASDTFAATLGVIPKLTDFGLAKMLEEDSDRTPAGAMIGTPEYMAPEQAEGRLEDITAATDVYGLGTVLYELLVGRPAFEGRTSADKLRRVLLDDPTDPRRRRPDIPRDLEAIVLRCLKKDPAERYADAAELAIDLQNFIAGRPTIARPLRPGHKLVKWAKRHPTESILVIVLSSFAIVAGVLGWLHHEQVMHQERQIEQAHLQAEEHQRSARVEHSKLLDMRYASDLRDARAAMDAADLSRATEILSRHLTDSVTGDRRSFAWKLLWQLCHQWDREILVHPDNAYCVGYSPDGRFLATGGARGELALTDLSTSKTRMLTPAHQGELNELDFSADGKWLVTCSDDGTIHVRNSAGEHLRTLDCGRSRLFAVRIHPELPLVLTGDDNKRISLWNIETGELAGEWLIDCRTIDAVAFTIDGRGLLAGDSDGAIWCVDDFESGQPRLLSRLAGSVLAMVSVPNRSTRKGPGRVMVGGRNRQITEVDIVTSRVVRQWSAHRDWIQKLVASADGRWIVSVSRDRTMKIWESATGRLIARVVAAHERLWGAAIHPDQEQIATSSADGVIRVWSRSHMGESPTLARFPEPAIDLVAGPGEREVIAASRIGDLTFWDVGSMRQLGNWKLDDEIVALDSSTKGTFAVALASGTVQMYAWQPDNKRADLLDRATVASPFDLAMSPDGRRLAIACLDGSVLLMNVSEAGKVSPPERLPIHAKEDRWSKVRFSPDGALLVTGAFDSTMAFWDPQKVAWIRTLHRPHTISDFVFDPASAFLAIASPDSPTVIESVEYGRRVASLMTGDQVGQSICYSVDGKNLVIGQADGSIRIWDVHLPQELFRETTRLQEISHAVMTRDGENLVLSGKDKETGRGLVLVRSTRLVAKDLMNRAP